MPITRHPLFPAMVALWFAALFSLGSLAIGAHALEGLVLALNLDAIVPAAAPPLGLTSRILLALIMFALGAVLGLVLALRLARGAQPASAARPVFATAAARDETDDDDFARLDAARASQPIAGRRRALAIDDTYEVQTPDFAPLPGGAPEILDLSILDSVATEVPEELEAYTSPFEQFAAPSGERVIEAVAEPDNGFGAKPFAKPAEVDGDAPAFANARAFDGPAGPAIIDAAEQSALAADADEDQPAFAGRFSAPAPVVEAEVVTPAPAGLPAFVRTPQDSAEKLLAAPLASLGVVELAERLALAISRRRNDAVPADESIAAESAVASASTLEPEIVPVALPEAAEVEPIWASPSTTVAAQLAPEAAPMVPVPVIPAALRPLDFGADDDDDVDESLSSFLPPRRFTAPTTGFSASGNSFAAPAAAEPVVGDDDFDFADDAEVAVGPGEAAADEQGDVAAKDDAYGSLLGMKPVTKQAFVRVDEPEAEDGPIEPVVVFPGQGQRLAFAPPSNRFEAPDQASAPDTMRRFDAPPAPSAPMPVVSAGARPADPEETERALKAALATLQRMSGAA